jgi:hypothetical protein
MLAHLYSAEDVKAALQSPSAADADVDLRALLQQQASSVSSKLQSFMVKRHALQLDELYSMRSAKSPGGVSSTPPGHRSAARPQTATSHAAARPPSTSTRAPSQSLNTSEESWKSPTSEHHSPHTAHSSARARSANEYRHPTAANTAKHHAHSAASASAAASGQNNANSYFASDQTLREAAHERTMAALSELDALAARLHLNHTIVHPLFDDPAFDIGGANPQRLHAHAAERHEARADAAARVWAAESLSNASTAGLSAHDDQSPEQAPTTAADAIPSFSSALALRLDGSAASKSGSGQAIASSLPPPPPPSVDTCCSSDMVARLGAAQRALAADWFDRSHFELGAPPLQVQSMHDSAAAAARETLTPLPPAPLPAGDGSTPRPRSRALLAAATAASPFDSSAPNHHSPYEQHQRRHMVDTLGATPAPHAGPINGADHTAGGADGDSGGSRVAEIVSLVRACVDRMLIVLRTETATGGSEDTASSASSSSSATRASSTVSFSVHQSQAKAPAPAGNASGMNDDRDDDGSDADESADGDAADVKNGASEAAAADAAPYTGGGGGGPKIAALGELTHLYGQVCFHASHIEFIVCRLSIEIGSFCCKHF